MNIKHPSRLMLNKILPKVFTSGGTFQELLPNPLTLNQQERLAVLQRMRDLARRECEKELLQQIGLPLDTPLQRSKSGTVIWPHGWCGSMSNKGPVVLGAIARVGEILSIGIDVEIVEKSDLCLLSSFSTDDLLLEIDNNHAVTLAFSAKEAFFKCQFPLTEQTLDLRDINLRWQSHTNQFFPSSSLLASCQMSFEGRYSISPPWVVTAALAYRI